MKRQLKTQIESLCAYSPPLFAGASLKPQNEARGRVGERHSPPLFAGASLKPADRAPLFWMMMKFPPAFRGGPFEAG